MPTRTSRNGFFRFDRDFTRHGIGRIQLSSGTNRLAEFRSRDALLTKLLNNGQLDILRAFARGDVSIQQLVDADARNVDTRLTLATIKLKQPLWTTATSAIDAMDCEETTKKRYRVSLLALRRKARRQLRDTATLVDLEKVNWRDLLANWGNSPADFNHMRRMVSAVLTAELGDVYHPFRRAVMNVKSFPQAHEGPGRTPDITPERFWAAVDRIPPHAQPIPVALVLTGMRIGEFLRTTDADKRPATLQVRIPGTKTDESDDFVSVDERMWPWIERAIPSPLKYKWLRLHWKRACRDVGMPEVTLHYLRHCHGQWAVNEGLAEAKVQVSVRHATADMTRRYVKQRDRGEVARAIGDAMAKRAV